MSRYYYYKFRLYPTGAQARLIQQTFGCVRYVYNYYLAQRLELYKATGKSPTRFAQDKDLTRLKREDGTQWLQQADKCALQNALKHLDVAYQNFFRNLRGGMKVGCPQFKRKKGGRLSYTTNCNIKLLDGFVRLPKLGKVKCRISKEVRGRIISATVSRNPSGRYFVSLCCTGVEHEKLPVTGVSVGLDVGIKDLVTTSDGKAHPNHKYLAKSEKKLARLQRQLSRKSKGSNNRNKARIKVARLHEHIANQRNDMLHKLSTEIVRENDVICIEGLAVKNMVKNHKLSKAISDASWGEFRRQLAYKAEQHGRKLVVIDRFYPSSQLCSECGTRWAGTKDMSVREWICPNCGATHNRDVNAAQNILNEGLRLLA